MPSVGFCSLSPLRLNVCNALYNYHVFWIIGLSVIFCILKNSNVVTYRSQNILHQYALVTMEISLTFFLPP